ncbi:MAG: glycosyltransferase family 2 protein [Bacteroidetes bacterium]|nr:glycosyltransferase family 2 protein [Bacteroidota bacterium]
MTTPLVSIILPCYKEEEHLLHSIDELLKVARGFDFPYELIFVEDYSPDMTAVILKKLESTLTNARFIYHSGNKGRGAAIKSGFEAARGDIIGYMDVDLEVSPLYIADMVDALQTYDVVVGKRSYYYQLSLQSVLRNSLSHFYRRLSRYYLKHPFTDTEAGYKFFRKKAVLPFFDHIENNHWFWDTEFMTMVHRHKLKVLELPVEFVRNNKKQSTVKPVKDSIVYISELKRYRKKLRKGK